MGTTGNAPSAPPLVLLVDDDPILLRSLQRWLTGLPIRLRCVESASLALAAVRAERAALVVSDHNMPGMTGLELLAHVRRQDLAAAVVLYTSDPDARQRAVAQGLGVLDKSEPPERLRELVASHAAPGAVPPP